MARLGGPESLRDQIKSLRDPRELWHPLPSRLFAIPYSLFPTLRSAGVDGFAHKHELVVHVRAGGETGAAGFGDDLALLHLVPRAHEQPGIVAV